MHPLVESILDRPGSWAFALFVAYTIGQQIRAYYRLRHIKGSWHTAWTDLWLIRKTWRGETFKELHSLCNKYGPVFRIAPNYIVCGDPAEIRTLWAARSSFDRAIWYKGFRFDPPNDTLVSMCGGDDRIAYRAKFAPGYGGRGVVGIHEAVDAGIIRLARLIDDKYISTETEYRPCDLARKVQFMTLDISGKIAFGETLGFLDGDADQWNYIEQSEASLPLMQVIAMRPWVVNLLQSRLLRRLAMPSAKDPVGLGKIIGIAQAFVAKRFGPDKVEAPDMLGSFIKNGVDQRTAETESVLQVIAGSDTTAGTIRTAIAHIITSPLVYSALVAEITSAISAESISSPVITDTEARSLPFLQATLKEALRIWPPIHGIMPRVSKSDATICGVHIPAGTNVCWSSCAVLRNKEVFGADADVFRPERWLKADKEKLSLMETVVDLAFASGRWGCLGKGIAMVEMGKVVFEVMRRWEFTVVDAEKPIQNYFTGMLVQSDLWVRIEKRKLG
ncbi:benzoate 4-monooxygenase cytochrome P450 [Cercophora newfieldiana]|uniref:Benzoate 4-monooxygenase cytochrome P450 n=1 Tax=Cercophora newfieldiana TaxID=92897 RepID=A0AA39Y1F4_9PEZI|nr:benzoate 4-monooxygenase cytochrome P450 [Cercophora newfieldiana]